MLNFKPIADKKGSKQASKILIKEFLKDEENIDLLFIGLKTSDSGGAEVFMSVKQMFTDAEINEIITVVNAVLEKKLEYSYGKGRI